MRNGMKIVTLKRAAAAALLTLSGAGCIIAPVAPVPPPGVVVPPGVVYVAPAYVAPGPGYYWRYHSGYGWGWHHPEAGWHRGWR